MTYRLADLYVNNDKDVEDYLRRHGEEIVGQWIDSETELENGRVTKDIAVVTKGFLMDPYPMDPIVIHRDLEGNENLREVVIYTAIRVSPNFSRNEETLYPIDGKEPKGGEHCVRINVDNPAEELVGLSGSEKKELERLIDSIKTHRTAQRTHLKNIRETHIGQIGNVDEEIDRVRKQKEGIQLLVKTFYDKYTPLMERKKTLFDDWAEYKLVFDTVTNSINVATGKAEAESAELYNHPVKIVYTLKSLRIDEDDDFKEKFMQSLDPKASKDSGESDFQKLMVRIKELRNIEVYPVLGGKTQPMSGVDFYIEPSLDSIREYAIYGPVINAEISGKASRTMTYVFALKAELNRSQCPKPEKGGDVFSETNFNAATAQCRPCQLPSIRDLLKKEHLEDGEYWTRDTEGLQRKVFIKGRNLVNKYASDILASGNFNKISDSVGVLLVDPSGSALSICVNAQ